MTGQCRASLIQWYVSVSRRSPARNSASRLDGVVPRQVLESRVLAADGAHRRRRREQHLDAVLLDHAPERPGVGRADRLALVEHRGRPGEQRAVDDVAVADDPAHVGGRPHHVAGVDVVDVRHRPGEGDRVAAVVAHDALRRAGRARGVEDVERVGRRDVDRPDGLGCRELVLPVDPAHADAPVELGGPPRARPRDCARSRSRR